MSTAATWTATVLEGIRSELSDNLGDALDAIEAAGGAAVIAPAAFRVQDDLDTVSTLPFVGISVDGSTTSTEMIPASYRLEIPLIVTVICQPEQNPFSPDEIARTYARAVLNTISTAACRNAITGLFWVGEPGTRVDRLDTEGHRWRRAGVTTATLHVATPRSE
jgi:hypothetical protein